MMNNPVFIVYDINTNEVITEEEYKENQKKKRAGDPTARDVRIIDKHMAIIENGKIVGTRRVTRDSITPKITAKSGPAPTPIQAANVEPKYPTSISDYVVEEPQIAVPTQGETTPTHEEPKYQKNQDVNDRDLFIKLLNQIQEEKKKEPTQALNATSSIAKDTAAVFSFESPAKDDSELFLKVIEHHRRLKKQQAQGASLEPTHITSQITIENDSKSQEESSAFSHATVDSIISEAKLGVYDTPEKEEEPTYEEIFSQSVSKASHPIKRNRKLRYITPKQALSIAIVTGATIASLGIIGLTISNSNAYQNLKDDIQMTSIIHTLIEHKAAFNNVSPNKVIIPNQYDSYNNPCYWLDTDGVAKGILNEGDPQYAAALYYAYYEMDGIRDVGDYHNWDNVISSIARMASEETHPIAYNMTSGCLTFNQFLIKNGLLNEDGTPSPKMFEEFGKAALREYSESLSLNEETPNHGGRV